VQDVKKAAIEDAQARLLSCVDALLSWYDIHARSLPWRENRDPYRIWVSEIMLQQTRVEAVKPYFTRFMERLPTIRDLADVSEDELLKLWEGLGYYSRARNLQKAAQVICMRYDGVFPQEHERILELPGIGSYTAGAIASICFEQPTPAVDGNVLRVLTRITGDETDITLPAFKKYAETVLSACYPVGNCGKYTQSLMELGATVCIPNGAPLCGQCPVRMCCAAYAQNRQTELPVKAPKKPRRIEEKTVFLFFCGDKVAVRKRIAKGLLHGLWEFPNTDGHLTDIQAEAFLAENGFDVTTLERAADAKHIFTHVEWHMQGYTVQCVSEHPDYIWATASELHTDIPLPSAFRKYTEITKTELEKRISIKPDVSV